ncbi:ead/Ea22-like family protein [uncultured Brevundimonas sp.]|uniref:ead/Ea22-like family protein n=1 Tax=uncultured Brevundimonas sp. TaxID=213418 RepID=UPI00262A1B7B|nr:ead/Ea22-like family protein [uncultured Brevundimonas sp.]
MSGDLSELRALAQGATPGPWEAHRYDEGDCWHIKYNDRGNWLAEVYTDDPGDGNDAAFIAAANPARIISLLDALQAQTERADKAVGASRLDGAVIEAAIEFAWPDIMAGGSCGFDALDEAVSAFQLATGAASEAGEQAEAIARAALTTTGEEGA